MNDLTRYRFVEYDIPDTDERGEKLVSDDTLQQIADAWKKFRGHREWAPELYELLDGLVSDDS